MCFPAIHRLLIKNVWTLLSRTHKQTEAKKNKHHSSLTKATLLLTTTCIQIKKPKDLKHKKTQHANLLTDIFSKYGWILHIYYCNAQKRTIS